MTQYYLEWMVELRKTHDNIVEFFGQEDKAKIPIGEKVPISNGVHANNRGLKAVNNTEALKAMGHDFHVGNIVTSVTAVQHPKGRF